MGETPKELDLEERMKNYLKTRTAALSLSPEPPREEPLTLAERKPDQNYDVLSVKISYNLRSKFEKMAEERKLTPSALARQVIEEFVTCKVEDKSSR